MYKKICSVVVFAIGIMMVALSPVAMAENAGVDTDKGAIVLAAVNINTASAKEMSSELKGIGLKKAEAIVNYRNTHGPFKSTGELADVKGIGKGILQRNADRIVVE